MNKRYAKTGVPEDRSLESWSSLSSQWSHGAPFPLNGVVKLPVYSVESCSFQFSPWSRAAPSSWHGVVELLAPTPAHPVAHNPGQMGDINK